jgi:hypothetical protein
VTLDEELGNVRLVSESSLGVATRTPTSPEFANGREDSVCTEWDIELESDAGATTSAVQSGLKSPERFALRAAACVSAEFPESPEKRGTLVEMLMRAGLEPTSSFPFPIPRLPAMKLKMSAPGRLEGSLLVVLGLKIVVAGLRA